MRLGGLAWAAKVALPAALLLAPLARPSLALAQPAVAPHIPQGEPTRPVVGAPPGIVPIAPPPPGAPVLLTPPPIPLPSPAPVGLAPAVTASPPPEDTSGMGRKARLRGDDLAHKRPGGYFTGLPLADYDPLTRFGFGARAYYYNDGDPKDRYYAYTPYFHRVIAQAFFTTSGAQDHLIDYDAPNFLGTLFRLRATLEYEQASAWPYFGVGTRTLQPLSYPGAPGATFARMNDYERSQTLVQNGKSYGRYNYFGFQRGQLQLGIERLLLGGVLRPLIGVGLSDLRLTDLTGTQVDANDAGGNAVKAREAQTLLSADCAAKRILGCEAGFDNVIRLALSLDTRDFEPDPNSGVYAELSAEIGTKALGSQYDYARVMLSVRGFYSPFPKIADVVLAARGVYEVQTASTPFFSQASLPFIDDNHEGLGGLRTLRGYQQNRFVGPVITLTNYEVRWTFAHFKALKQDFRLVAVPFLDMGRIYDRVSQTTFAGWKRSQGGGLRIAWNEATIILADYGFSEEDSGFYLNFGHMF